MTSEELLAKAEATDLRNAKAEGEGRSFTFYWPTAKHFRDKGMSFSWIFKWCLEQSPELEGREESFNASMSGRYKRHQNKLMSRQGN